MTTPDPLREEAELFRFEVPTSQGVFVVIGPSTLPANEAERIGAQIAKLLPLMVLEPNRCPFCAEGLPLDETGWHIREADPDGLEGIQRIPCARS